MHRLNTLRAEETRCKRARLRETREIENEISRLRNAAAATPGVKHAAKTTTATANATATTRPNVAKATNRTIRSSDCSCCCGDCSSRAAVMRCRGPAPIRAGTPPHPGSQKKCGSHGRTPPAGPENGLFSGGGGGQPACSGGQEVGKRDYLLEAFLDRHAKSFPFEAGTVPPPPPPPPPPHHHHHACECRSQQEDAGVPGVAGVTRQRWRGCGGREGLGEAGRDGLDIRVLW